MQIKPPVTGDTGTFPVSSAAARSHGGDLSPEMSLYALGRDLRVEEDGDFST